MRLPVHIWIREENATPEEVAGYFTELARRLDAHPQKMRLVIESSVPAVLDFDPSDGEPVVSVGGLSQKFSLRHRWLPEHPVPLPLGFPASSLRSVPNKSLRLSRFARRLFPKRRLVLLIDPVDGNRFRVRSRCTLRVPHGLYAIFAIVAVVAVVTLHPLALAFAVLLLIGFAGIAIRS